VVFSTFVTACLGTPETEVSADVGDASAVRIISLAPHITELVYAAGAGDSLVGAVEYSDYPAAARDVPRIGDAFRVDYEEIALLEPDLLLAWGSGTPREVVERLRSMGYRVVELEPESIEAIAAELREVGELAGTTREAEQKAEAMLREFGMLQSLYGGRPPLKVFFQISPEPLFTVGGEHVISAIIEICSGQNVFADVQSVAPSVSMEAVIATNPDVILAAVSGGDTAWEQPWRSWQRIPAVEHMNLYSINRDLISRSGPRIVAGARQVCEALEQARANQG